MFEEVYPLTAMSFSPRVTETWNTLIEMEYDRLKNKQKFLNNSTIRPTYFKVLINGIGELIWETSVHTVRMRVPMDEWEFAGYDTLWG